MQSSFGSCRLLAWFVLKTAAAFAALLGIACPALAGEVTVSWDPNPEPDIGGYLVSYGTESQVYTRTVDAGPSTSLRIPELVSGFTYYFVVVAYTVSNIESPASGEAMFTVPPPEGLQVVPLDPPGEPVAGGAPVCHPGVNEDGGFTLTVAAPDAEALTVYASGDLIEWEVLGTVFNPTGHVQIEELPETAPTQRFFRVKPAFLVP